MGFRGCWLGSLHPESCPNTLVTLLEMSWEGWVASRGLSSGGPESPEAASPHSGLRVLPRAPGLPPHSGLRVQSQRARRLPPPHLGCLPTLGCVCRVRQARLAAPPTRGCCLRRGAQPRWLPALFFAPVRRRLSRRSPVRGTWTLSPPPLPAPGSSPTRPRGSGRPFGGAERA